MAVRRAVEADIEALARVQVASWEGAYRGVMPDEIFDTVTLDWRIAQWRRMFAAPVPGRTAWVATGRNGIAGMASNGPARGDDEPDSRGELYAIYVDPDHWGEGHGRDLMAAVLDDLITAGYAEAMLWVLNENSRARRFYEIAGWSPSGEEKVDEFVGIPLHHVQYVRPLP